MHEADCVHIMEAGARTPGGTGSTRRGLFKGAGALAFAAAAPAAAAGSQADAELLSVLAAFDAIERRIKALWAPGPHFIADEDARALAEEPLEALRLPLVSRLCALPARTPEGWRARARTLLLYDDELASNLAAGDDPDEYTAERMVIALVRDLVAGAA